MQKKAHMQDLFKKVARGSGYPIGQVKEVITEFIRVIISELANGRTVYIMSLGKFWLKPAAAQKAWDWTKQKHIELGERLVPKFKFSNRVYIMIREEASRLIDEQPEP